VVGADVLPPPPDTRTPLTLLGDAVSNAAMFAAVLVLGEAVRSRQALDREHRLLLAEEERSERLLLNVLPAPIAERLKQGEGVIADAFPEVTVLFADLVDFTRRSQQVSPAQVVATLNELFSAFDRLAQRHGLEKIKTIGDAYMVAGGLPNPRTRPRPSGGRNGPGDAGGGGRARRPQRPAAAGPDRHRYRPGGGRGDRDQQVQL
jgi:class 3 adenylate cyclase